MTTPFAATNAGALITQLKNTVNSVVFFVISHRIILINRVKSRHTEEQYCNTKEAQRPRFKSDNSYLQNHIDCKTTLILFFCSSTLQKVVHSLLKLKIFFLCYFSVSSVKNIQCNFHLLNLIILRHKPNRLK